MKLTVSLVILLSFTFVDGVKFAGRCLLFHKKCVHFCPRLMHPYDTRCDRDTMSQRTCDSPHIYSLGYTCGWSRCDCNGDLLLDEDEGHCVPIGACKKFRKRRRPRNKRKPFRMSKRLRIVENEDLIDT